LGKIDAPFFGAPKKEKRGERRGRTPFFIAPSAGLWASPVVVLSRRWSVPRSTRRREAGAGAAEVVKGVVALPTPGVEA